MEFNFDLKINQNTDGDELERVQIALAALSGHAPKNGTNRRVVEAEVVEPPKQLPAHKEVVLVKQRTDIRPDVLLILQILNVAPDSAPTGVRFLTWLAENGGGTVDHISRELGYDKGVQLGGTIGALNSAAAVAGLPSPFVHTKVPGGAGALSHYAFRPYVLHPDGQEPRNPPPKVRGIRKAPGKAQRGVDGTVDAPQGRTTPA